MDEAAVLRRELSRLEAGRGRRYPQELRARVVAWASRRHRAGASWEEIKKELGLQWDSVRRWCQVGAKIGASTSAGSSARGADASGGATGQCLVASGFSHRGTDAR